MVIIACYMMSDSCVTHFSLNCRELYWIYMIYLNSAYFRGSLSVVKTDISKKTIKFFR
jgi:hypothetical protein